jgi:hypothetical protein
MITGRISANGGSQRGGGGVGSGGAIRIVANALDGTGSIQCIPGTGGSAGGGGRIRIERVTSGGSLQVAPDPSVVPLQAGATPLLWLPTDGPTARIVSIGGANVAGDPRASFGTYGPDVTLPQVSTTPVIVETINAEDAFHCHRPRNPSGKRDFLTRTAVVSQVVSPGIIRWTADVPVQDGYSAVQARVVRP